MRTGESLLYIWRKTKTKNKNPQPFHHWKIFKYNKPILLYFHKFKIKQSVRHGSSCWLFQHWRVEAGESGIQGHTQQSSKFKTSLCHIRLLQNKDKRLSILLSSGPFSPYYVQNTKSAQASWQGIGRKAIYTWKIRLPHSQSTQNINNLFL